MTTPDGESAQSGFELDQPATFHARLDAAADDVDAKAKQLQLARRLRDELIVKATETGMPMREAARHARVHHSRVVQILSTH